MDDNTLDNGQKGTRGMLLPRLRKNRRLEKRWGDKYYVAVKEAVFMFRATHHMPLDTPLSLHQESDDCEQLYVCKQCNDCFRFLSSLEAHNSRRSWILGYWCNNCFLIDCTHSVKGQPPCFECQTMNRQRTLFLRSKGLRKGRKLGSIKIFYNQCQFYSHLRMHETTVVDMADLMLMPIPTDVDKKSYAELEHICETIMERMFLTRTHILDWLKSHQLGNDWWRCLLQSNSINDGNPLDEMLGTTGRTRGIRKSVKNTLKSQKILSTDPASSASSSFKYPPKYDRTSSISRTIESVVSQSNWEESDPLSSGKIPVMPPLSSFHHIDRLESIEDDDNPCTTADIAFVDCGPAAKTYPPDVAIVLPPKDKLTIIPNGSNSGQLKTDSHSSLRVSGNPLSLKQLQAHNVVHANSSSTVSPGSHRAFEPKISVKKFANERLSTSPDIHCQKNYPRIDNEAPQAVRRLTPVSSVRLSGGKRPLPSVIEIARAVETSKKVVSQASLSNLGSKILTVHTPKNTDLSKIISQLPPEVINGKKIVFIGQDSERFTILPKNDTSSSSVGMIKIQSDIDKPKIGQIPPMKIAPMVVSDIESEQMKKKASADNNIKPKIQPVYIDGKVIYQNGKKFIIRQARKPIPEATVCTNINNLKLQTIPRHLSLSTFLANPQLPLSSCIPISPKPSNTGTNKILYPSNSSPFTSCSTSPSLSSSPSPSLSPSPSTSGNPKGLKGNALIRRRNRNSSESGVEILTGPQKTSEKQSLTSTPLTIPPMCYIHAVDAVEYLSIHKNFDGSKSYVDFSNVKKEIIWTQTTQNYQQQMVDNFRRCGRERTELLIDHLNHINEEFTKILGTADDERISDNLKAIKYLEIVSKEEATCSDKDQDTEQPSSVDDINKIISNLKETRQLPFVCPTCDRSIESDSHILEFSKGSGKNLGCGNCNIYVCYVCDVYQGNISRYRAHINFHAKKEPYTCPECFRKFPSYLRLQTHVWTTCFHPLIRKWFKCRICSVEGFPNMESVTEHFILAHSRLKIACPECGLLLKSEHDFENHAEEDHPKVINRLKPVNLMACDIGSCVVRMENFRSHMDHHSAVTNVIHYKCPFCSFLVKAMKRGREQIRAHLHEKHSDRLRELGSPENVQLDSAKQLITFDDKSQSHNNSHMHDISMIDLCSDKNDQDKEVIESEQPSDLSESMQKNLQTMVLNNIANYSQAHNELSSKHLAASSTKKTLKNDVNRSICTLDLGNMEESPERTDLGTDSLEITTTMKQAVNTPNIIMEYSSSPKIFDVRSVTPDSYAEFGVGTKEQISPMGKTAEGTVQSVSGTIKDGVGATESFLIKMGDQFLPMELPQMIVVNQAEGDINLSEMLQSPLTAPNTFIKLSDLTNSDASNNLESATELTDRNVDVPQPGQCKKTTSASATVRKFQGSVERWQRQSVNGRKQMLSISVLNSKNNSIANSRTDLTEPETHVSNLHSQVDDESQIVTNSWGNCEGITADPLLCNLRKPPPLARIPQHLLELSRVKDEISEDEVEEIKVTTPRSVVRAWRRQRRPWRIALNAPIQSSEIINYRCHLCRESINTSWSVLENHFNSRHSEDYKLSILTPRLLNMSSDFINEGYKEVIVSKKRKSDGSSSSSKRRRRWNPRKQVDKHSLDSGLCVQQESLQDGEGNFVCKKCDEQCNDILSLRTHIGTNHRIKDHYLVCLECGENFVVEPSLQMHLKAFHSIQDPPNYMAQNPGYAKEITETVEDESNTGIANQCHVCMAVFEDKLAVDKHLRVHGMAFLNRKRMEARNAARNPEKRSRIDKPDESLNDDAAAASATEQKHEKLENHKLAKIESVNETVRES